MYGSETWPMKVDDMLRLERTENGMVRWMSGVSLKDKRSSEELRSGLGIVGVDRVIRRGRLRRCGHVACGVRRLVIGFLSAEIWRWSVG